MWERRSYNDGDSYRCTVKYSGQIPQWGNSPALGVEWDDPERGKNSGDIQGLHYFHTRVVGAGSFIRVKRIHEKSRTFTRAFNSKYLEKYDYEELELPGNKRVSTYGFDKVERLYAQLTKLKYISLNACLVKELEWHDFDLFRSLSCLDLGNNLLESFDDIILFINKFPSLESVRLNGNRFKFSLESGNRKENLKRFGTNPIHCPKVKSLEISFSSLVDEEADFIVRVFSSLENISLAGNLLTHVPHRLSTKLRVLDISGNKGIKVIPESLPFSLQSANFSGTCVSNVSESTKLPPFVNLRRTPLVQSRLGTGVIFNWASISQLHCQRVTELNLLGTEDMDARTFVIARCGHVTKLDGTEITELERNNAEIYAMSAVTSKKHPAIPARRWDELVQIHGEPVGAPSRSIQARLLSIQVDNAPDIVRIVGDAPLYRLKALVARATNQDVSSFEIDGVTDTLDLASDLTKRLLQVKDVIVDGQHVRTFQRSDVRVRL